MARWSGSRRRSASPARSSSSSPTSTSGQQFKYPNTDEGRQRYLADARAFIAQVMAAAPRWFRRLPRAPLEVRAVEAFRQETAAVAFYNRPSPDGSRPGIFYVNLADMNQVLRPQVEAIAYHEGAPGHHFQIALAQELPDMPKFRRFGGNSAYGEGWGLYAERLAKEMGFYREPMSASSACSRPSCGARSAWSSTPASTPSLDPRAGDRIFHATTACSRARDATKEVERYFNNPGQATSYMIGQLKILELRDRARPGAWATASTSAISTRWCWRTAACRSTCWRSWSTAGSRRTAADAMRRFACLCLPLAAAPAGETERAPTRPARVPARAKPISASPTTMPAKSSTSYARSGSESGASLAFRVARLPVGDG